MYKCYNQLREGCLSVKVTQIRDPVVADAQDVGKHLVAKCEGIKQDIKADVTDAAKHICCKTTDIAEHLQVCCSLICSSSKNYYLEVAPTVVWLTPEMLEGEFGIYSNVNWNIN